MPLFLQEGTFPGPAPFPPNSGVLPQPRPSLRPRPPALRRALAAPPLPVPRAGTSGAFHWSRPSGVLRAERRESLGPGFGGPVAGLRRLGRFPSSPCRPFSEEPFPRRRGDAGEPPAEGPLGEPAATRARHGAGEWRGLGPQPRRA